MWKFAYHFTTPTKTSSKTTRITITTKTTTICRVNTKYISFCMVTGNNFLSFVFLHPSIKEKRREQVTETRKLDHGTESKRIEDL